MTFLTPTFADECPLLMSMKCLVAAGGTVRQVTSFCERAGAAGTTDPAFTGVLVLLPRRGKGAILHLDLHADHIA